jgi:1,4-dihydroxy-2-naphthoate octaprenyltransferase
VQLHAVPGLAWWAAIPVGSLATAILVVNNLRDRNTDVRAGKRTLAVRFGRRAALVEYAVLLALAYAVPLGLAVHHPWRALPVITAPLALVRFGQLVLAGDGPTFNELLAQTGQLLLLHGLLFSAGLVM